MTALSARTRGLTIRVGVAMPLGGSTVDELWTLVDALEELGYDSLWVSDTVTRGGLAIVPVLAAVAARTERLKLGTSVLTLPPRNPVLLARELATIDALSGGRLLPAGGLGIDDPVERAALGIAGDERVARLEESVHVIRLLWSGERVSYDGRFCRLDGVRLEPAPVRPKLELWLGGRVPAALRRIGRIADGWLASLMAPEAFAEGADIIRAAAREAGRTIDEDHYGTTVICAASAEDAAAAGYPERIRALRFGAPVEDTFAVGPVAARELLERFVAVGASKFVVVPVARDLPGWLRTLRDDVVAPVESGAGR